jgi:hypothetical protein
MPRRTSPITSKPKSLNQEKADFTAEGAPAPKAPLPTQAPVPAQSPTVVPVRPLPSGGAD